MQKVQYLALFSSFLLLLTMYIGCETKASNVKDIAKARTLVAENTTREVLEMYAKRNLESADLLLLENLNLDLERNGDLNKKAEIARKLSAKWYDLNHPAIAGAYAEMVAEWFPSAEAWSIAGTTFGRAIAQKDDVKIREFAAKHAVTAFENAVSLSPEDWTNKLNLALVLTDVPPQENPMKGVKMLLALNDSYPDNARILFHLGRLAIQTGQFEKAVERLEKSLELDASQPQIYCLLERAYRETEKSDLAAKASDQCRNSIK
jgi:tetratricopeptide (TPR) repeat protein